MAFVDYDYTDSTGRLTPGQLYDLWQSNKQRLAAASVSPGDRMVLELAVETPTTEAQELTLAYYQDNLFAVTDAWSRDMIIRRDPEVPNKPTDEMLYVEGSVLGAASALSAVTGMLWSLASVGISYAIVKFTIFWEQPEAREEAKKTVTEIGEAVTSVALPLALPAIVLVGLLVVLASE